MKMRFFIILILTFLVACSPRAASRIEGASNTTLPANVEGVLAPDFTLPDVYGRKLQLSSLRGKTVVLSFWASWCTPCIQELKLFDQLVKKHRSMGVEVLAVGVRDLSANLTSMAHAGRYRYPILIDSRDKVASLYGVSQLPETFVIDPNGRFVSMLDKATGVSVSRFIGARNWMSPEYQAFLTSI